jgi:RimJ/RimL family protein N-acetyltransferase
VPATGAIRGKLEVTAAGLTAMLAIVLPDEVSAGPILLRRRQHDDVPDLLVAIESSIDELSRFLRWAASGTPSRRDFEDVVAVRDRDFEAGTGFEYVLIEADSGQIVGEAGGDVCDDRSVVDVGYWVRTDRTGRGYTTAAARALISMVFDALPDVARVEIRMDKGNAASRVVAERLGLTLVGEETFDEEPLPGQTGQGWIWSMDRASWSNTRS